MLEAKWANPANPEGLAEDRAAMIKNWHVAVAVALIYWLVPWRRVRLALVSAIILALFFVVPG